MNVPVSTLVSQSTSVGPPLELFAKALAEEGVEVAPTLAVTELPMLPLPLAVPVPETETVVVTLAVEVLAVLDAPAD